MTTSARIRILFVLPSEVRGGAEEVVLSLLRGLDPERFEPALACPAALLKTLGRDLGELDVRTLAVEPGELKNVRDARRLARFIRDFQPHVVNPHLFRATLVAAPIAKLLGVPLVIETYHGREAWRRGLVKGSFFIDRFVHRFVDRVIAVSEAAATFLVETKGLSPRKITVVPNGRELSEFLPGVAAGDVRRELRIAPDTPLLGVVGRLEPQKGHCFLLDAMPSVLEAVPDVSLLVVGDGTLETELRERARTLGISERVRFLGYRKDVARVMDSLDVVVMPSLYEGMPLIAIEAAAMAKPIVAAAVDGTEEVVLDGETGVLVPPGDPRPLAEALVDLLQDLPRARAMGSRARTVAVERFDLTKQIQTTSHFYLTECERVGAGAYGHVR